ncbi:hypothetical protein MNBD_CHLOROFLEXI01-2859, partial [hydrothermal vent metagenome]
MSNNFGKRGELDGSDAPLLSADDSGTSSSAAWLCNDGIVGSFK